MQEDTTKTEDNAYRDEESLQPSSDVTTNENTDVNSGSSDDSVASDSHEEESTTDSVSSSVSPVNRADGAREEFDLNLTAVENTETPEPVEEPEPTESPSPAPQESAPSGGSGNEAANFKVLLVEDDVALASVYRSRLELEGFMLREVNDGEQALTAAKEFQPDLILLDAMMPKISGFDVLDILRNTPETANIKVIMLTALSQPKDKERAENLGVDDYLVKSQVVIGDVVERVKHHLNIK